MAISKTLLGTSREIPQSGNKGWGSTMTTVAVDLIDIANVNTDKNAAGSKVNILTVDTQTPAASATLVVNGSLVRISGSAGAVTLNTTTPIANGEFNGQLLELSGINDTNTVTIESGGTNVKMNGDVTLTDGDHIKYWWDNTSTVWQERGRNN